MGVEVEGADGKAEDVVAKSEVHRGGWPDRSLLGQDVGLLPLFFLGVLCASLDPTGSGVSYQEDGASSTRTTLLAMMGSRRYLFFTCTLYHQC